MSADREQEYRETARTLVKAHLERDPRMTEAYLVPDPQLDDVRLIEVSADIPTSGDVLPFHYRAAPDLGIPFKSTLVLLSPEEWSDVQAHRLAFPSDWNLDEREKLH